MARLHSLYPLDLLLCLLVSLLLVPLVFFNIEPMLRLILGLPFLLFVPGYVLVFALFPARKTDRGIDTLERVVLSFGLSIAVVPLIGLLLNYTPWGIRLEPVLLSVLFFIIGMGLYGMYRWRKTDVEERFVLPLKLSLPRQESRVDRALTVILIVAILVVLVSLVYVIALPRTGETFTEFYLLGPQGNAEGYPRNLTTQQNATVIIGIANHEHHDVNYTIEIWLVNQTIVNNHTLYNQMWFLDMIPVNLPSQPVNTGEPWSPQWNHTYTFSINRTGTFKLAFLLLTTPDTARYQSDTNYRDVANQILAKAYREAHLWLTIR
ncbi:MAG TPA: DUF1616 domain-containing protein [Candidatus Thermoplasmatota archaeon]|nr:DUF1616 domain-containing protein [Candidatus Thermoplasmatota archaeon]